ncbi:MAG: transcriptional regulator [Mariniblastus sp.]
MPTKTVSKGITRYDVGATRGYNVRVTRNKVTHRKFFGDVAHGGKRKALKCARQHYAELVQKLPAGNTTKGMKHKRNKAGVGGIYPFRYETKGGGCNTTWWAAWLTDGNRRKVGFNDSIYGKRKSKQLAVIARELECMDREEVVKVFERRKKSKTRSLA